MENSNYEICEGCGWPFPPAELFDGKCSRCLDIDERRREDERFDRERIEQCRDGWGRV